MRYELTFPEKVIFTLPLGRNVQLSNTTCGVTGSDFSLASGLHRKLVDFESLESRDFSTMGLPCMQCHESFSTRHTFESAVYDKGVYFFCCKKCMDMWMSVNAQEIKLEDQQQLST